MGLLSQRSTMKYLVSFLLSFYFYTASSQVEEVVEAIDFERHISPLVSVEKSGKTYYYHPSTNIWIDDVDEYAADLLVVVKDDKYGLLRDDGELLVQIIYDDIKLETAYDGQWYDGIDYIYKFAVLTKDGKVGVVNEQGGLIVPFEYDEAKAINSAVIGVAINGAWGWVSAETGELLKQPEFEYISKYYDDGYVEVRNGDFAGVSKATGELIIPVKYEEYMRILYYGQEVRFEGKISNEVSVFDTTGTLLLSGHEMYQYISQSTNLIFKENGLYGIIDPLTKQTILAPSFESIGGFNRNLAVAKKNGKYGVISSSGEQLLSFDYDEISFLSAAGRYKSEYVPTAPFNPRNNKDIDTNKLKDRWDYEQEIDAKPYLIAVAKDDALGIFNWQGEAILPMGKYSGIVSHYYNGKTYYWVEKQGKYGIADEQGNEILPLLYSYDKSYQFSKSAVADEKLVFDRFISFSNGKKEGSYTEEIGVFDLETQQVIIPIAEQSIDIVSTNLIKVRKQLPNYQLAFYAYDIKEQKEIELPGPALDYHFLNNNFWVSEMNDKSYRLVSAQGEIVYQNPNWTSQESYNLLRFPAYGNNNHGAFYHGLKKMYGSEANLFVNENGQEKRFEDIDQVDAFYEGYAIAAIKVKGQKNYKYGMIDTTGNIVVPFEYDAVAAMGSDAELLQFKKGEVYGLVTRQARILLEPVYTYIDYNSKYSHIIIRHDEKYGLANRQGKILIQPQYDDLRRNYSGKDQTWPLLVTENGWRYFVNENGEKALIKAKADEY